MAQGELRFHVAAVLLLTVCTGCTNWREYVRNGFKVGPDYRKPAAPVAESWIDAADSRVSEESPALDQWWTAFNDPVLDRLIHQAATQNLTLQQAGFRVLQARLD